MPIGFRVDTVRRCVFVTGAPPVLDADLTQYQRDLAAHPDHGPGFQQLVDMRAVPGLHVTAQGVEVAGRLTELFADHLQGTKCAVVVSTDLAFGMTRMFAAHASDAIEIRVFEELNAAMSWLGLGD